MDPDQKDIYSIVEKHVKETEKKAGEPYSLVEALGLRGREVMSLVGAGGKTTLMFRLAKELVLAGKRVVTTTTTKIMEPSSEETSCLYIHHDEEILRQFVSQHINRDRHITIACDRIESMKLKGISSDLAGTLCTSSEMDIMIIEADGAAGRPAKAPREWEPVIPSNSTLVIGMLGVDGVGKEVNEQNLFQADRISELTGIPMGTEMTCEAMAILMTHRQGIFKGTPPSSRRIAFINKVDIQNGRGWGEEIAEKIFGKKLHQIERVVLGQLRSETPVAEVIFPYDKRR